MRWEPRQEALLSLKYEKSSWAELLSLFPGQTKNSIEKKASSLGLRRPMFSTSQGVYYNFGMCPKHGQVPKDEIIWTGDKRKVPRCPRCSRRVRLQPVKSKLKEKYRNVSRDRSNSKD